MAGFAGKAVGVVDRDNLREVSGLGRIRLVAADAEDRGIKPGRGQGSGIIRVPGQRPMAGFAIHVSVLATLFLVEDIGMAGFTGLMAGEIEWPGGDFGQRIAAIVSVLSETAGHHKASDNQKQDYARDEQSCQSEQMSRIFEGIHDAMSTRIFCVQNLFCRCGPQEPYPYQIIDTGLTLPCPASPDIGTCVTSVWKMMAPGNASR